MGVGDEWVGGGLGKRGPRSRGFDGCGGWPRVPARRSRAHPASTPPPKLATPQELLEILPQLLKVEAVDDVRALLGPQNVANYHAAAAAAAAAAPPAPAPAPALAAPPACVAAGPGAAAPSPALPLAALGVQC
jgi:hypothetical protein